MIEVRSLVVDLSSENGSPRRILNGIDLNISDGELIGIIGANGSGKTTFARCLNGLIAPTTGEIIVDGIRSTDEDKQTELRRRVGMVFQNPENQIVATTVEREIAFGLENLGMPRDEMISKVDEMLRAFDLEEYRGQSPHLLSGGETQRLALASVVAMQPKYLIFDEPTSLLDGRGRKMVKSLVRDLRSKSQDVTVLFITQFPEEALTCERLIVFHDGAVVMDGDPQTVYRDASAVVALGVGVPVEFSVLETLHQRTGQVAFDPVEFRDFAGDD